MKKFKKVLALILAVATMFSTVPIPNYAASNDTSVTSSDGSLIVDDVSNTIKSGTFSLTGNVTVSKLKSKLQTPATARVKVTSEPTTTAEKFEAAQDSEDFLGLYEYLRVAVMAEDKTLRTYSLIIKSSFDALVSEEAYYVDKRSSDASPDFPGEITANNTPITSAVTVDTFLNNLSKHATADWLVAPGTSTFANETALRLELATKTALSKSLSDKLAAGDKLWTVSGTGVVRAYNVTVTSVAPVTITELDLTTLVPVPVTGSNTIGTFETSQYTAEIIWIQTDDGTPLSQPKFEPGTKYSAKVDILPKAGYTLTGVAANSFTNTNATTVTNAINSGTVWMTFEKTPAAGDTTPPTFTNGFPSVTNVTQTSANFNVNLNEAGTVSYIFRPSSQDAPTQGGVSVLGITITVSAANTSVTKALNNLTANTAYKVYYVTEDAAHNRSALANITFTTTAPPVTPPSSGGSGGGGGGRSGASTPTSPTSPTSPISPAPTTTQSRPIDVIVNGVNKSAGTLITGQTSGGQQTATVSVSTSGVVEQLKTPATTGKPSVIVEIPKVSGTGLQATYSAEVTAQSATAMVGAGAGLSVRTPVSTVELSSGAMDTLSELMNRAGTGQSASLVVSASPASTTYRPATLGAAPIRSVLTTPIEYSTAVVTDSTRVAVSDYNAFVGRTLSVSPEMLTTAQGQGIPGGTQGVVYINGSAYPVPTFRADGKVTINSITNSVYDLIMYSKSFIDTKGHKYDKSITNMASRLIVTGESAERFNPNAKVTRGEFATMVTRALGLYRGEMGKTKFKDLTKINGINVGITVAADRGLVTGVGKNSFAPSNNITAKEMSQILFNIVKKYGDTSTFTNKASELKTTGYAKEAVAFTTKAGLLEVKSADKEMTRAEAAFAIEQMLEGMNLIDKR